jgi:acyl-CoA thioester hydrolase
MDSMGHVNNAVYFTYLESARISYFDALEIGKYRESDRHGPALVSVTCHFRRQVRYPATLDVGIRVSEIRRRSLVFVHEIYRCGADEIVADGTSIMAWVDYAVGKAIPLPDPLPQIILRFEWIRPTLAQPS